MPSTEPDPNSPGPDLDEKARARIRALFGTGAGPAPLLTGRGPRPPRRPLIDLWREWGGGATPSPPAGPFRRP